MTNINSLTLKAFSDIYELDKKYIGTADYIGLAYFWNYQYRHYLRDTSNSKRKKVHNAFLKEGLDIQGQSDRHLKIIQHITKLI
jgi:hypothetical protein